MVSKVLAAVLAVAVLSVGGYTYWQYADTGCCTPIHRPNAPAATSAADSVTLPCCQEPSRAACVTLAPGESCCEGTGPATDAKTEVLAIMPREVK